jgi:DNA-nicking Smr family endonuclease
MNDDDRELFRKALDNLPSDIGKAKFGGALRPRKQRDSRPIAAHDAVLDLHGMTRTAAVARLNAVLERANGKRRRILVITGRGNRSEDGVGVLREAVARYLETTGAHFVREYGSAAPEFGGEGAFDIVTR